MSSLQGELTDLALFEQISERDVDLAPGKGLDSIISLDPEADVLLDPKKYAILADKLSSNPEDEWLVLTRSASTSLGEIAVRRLKEVQLVRAAYDQVTGEIDQSETIKGLETELFDHYSEKLYVSALSKKIHLIEQLDVDMVPGADIAKGMLITDLETILPFTEKATPLIEPKAETLLTLQAWVNNQFGDVMEYIDSQDLNVYKASDIKRIFDFCIASTPAMKTSGWACELVDRVKGAISVYSAERKILVPTQREAPAETVKRLVIHEVFGHALRSAVAESNNNKIGRIGTATYQAFEESFEIALEQCLTSTYDPKRGLDHYIAIGIAVTSDKSKSEIASMFRSIKQLEKIATEQRALDPNELTSIENQIAQLVHRTFAGMTDVDEGIAHMKDINYLHGLNNAWSLLNFMSENNIVDQGMHWLMAGKFNPYSAIDRALIEKYHAMPKELVGYFTDNA